MARKERYAVSQDFVDQCTEVLSEFGAVRRSSFVKFIQKNLEIPSEKAEQILEKLAQRKDVFLAKYADTTIVKSASCNRATYKNLDAFEAYISILEHETSPEEKITAFINKATFPADFVIYVTSGIIYNVFVYDPKNLMQKLSIFSRKVKDSESQVTLIVFPVGTDLQHVRVPKLEGKYRYAVVRKSSTGKAVCSITEIQGEKKND